VPRLRLAWAILIVIAGCTPGVSEASSNPGTDTSSVAASPTKSTGPTADIVPWSSETPQPFITPAPAAPSDAAACAVDQVSAGVAGWQGATGSMLGGFLIWNTSGEPCRLTGRPSIAIRDATGHRLAVTNIPAPEPPLRPIVLPANQPAPVLFEEAPGGLAQVTIQWFNWCGADPAEPMSLAITLPEGGVLQTPVVMGGVPRCDEASTGSSVSVAAFGATPGPSPSDPAAVPAEALKVALEVPDQATAGQTLHYVIALTNPTASAIGLRPCPAYMERVNAVGGGVAVDYLLDCAGVPTIAPGASVRFAMELDIPASMPSSDEAAIVWSLDPYFSEGFAPRPPAAKQQIRIVAP
jgi:hypothetical protein